jgi:hypothetical protein
MASFTRSDLTRPFRVRFAIRLSLEVPELRHAIPKARAWITHAERERMALVVKDSVGKRYRQVDSEYGWLCVCLCVRPA